MAVVEIIRETSETGLYTEIDKIVNENEPITPKEIVEALKILRSLVGHTHAYTDTYESDCNCNCNCSRGLL